MTLTEQVNAQAVLMSGVDGTQEALLEILCKSAVTGLTQQLREGLTPEDCKADFVAAASLYALAALSETDKLMQVQQIQIGDMTLKRGGTTAAAACLRYQAELLMAPYLKERFCFRSV
jgi:hypothetical protein